MDLHDKPPRKPDLVGSLLDIPLETNSCLRVYCGHVLEHLEKPDVYVALNEIRRVLKPSGLLMIVGPDWDRTKKTDYQVKKWMKCGAGRWPGDAHKWIATEKEMVSFLENWHYSCIDIAEVGKEWPVVSHVYWQFAILCAPYA